MLVSLVFVLSHATSPRSGWVIGCEYAPDVCLHTCSSSLIFSQVIGLATHLFVRIQTQKAVTSNFIVCDFVYVHRYRFTMSVPASQAQLALQSQSQSQQSRHWWAAAGPMDVTLQTQHFPNITTGATSRDSSMPNTGMPV